MTRTELIAEVQQFFTLKELVCRHTYERYPTTAWRFLDYDALYTLLVLRRDVLQVPLICNSGEHTQRGLRCNMCPIVREKTRPYLSGHIMGKAFDLVSPAMTAARMRSLIALHYDLIPVPIRIEAGVDWLHFDTLSDGRDKVVLFDA